MGTNFISKKLSRVYTHPIWAKEYAEVYAEKMRARGYVVTVKPSDSVYPLTYLVEVLRKR